MGHEAYEQIREWCDSGVRADAADAQLTDDGMRCLIRSGDDEVEISLERGSDGRVKKISDGEVVQDWSGSMREIDLHEDGITAVSDHATFSMTWE